MNRTSRRLGRTLYERPTTRFSSLSGRRHSVASRTGQQTVSSVADGAHVPTTSSIGPTQVKSASAEDPRPRGRVPRHPAGSTRWRAPVTDASCIGVGAPSRTSRPGVAPVRAEHRTCIEVRAVEPGRRGDLGVVPDHTFVVDNRGTGGTLTGQLEEVSLVVATRFNSTPSPPPRPRRVARSPAWRRSSPRAARRARRRPRSPASAAGPSASAVAGATVPLPRRRPSGRRSSTISHRLN